LICVSGFKVAQPVRQVRGRVQGSRRPEAWRQGRRSLADSPGQHLRHEAGARTREGTCEGREARCEAGHEARGYRACTSTSTSEVVVWIKSNRWGEQSPLFLSLLHSPVYLLSRRYGSPFFAVAPESPKH
jgi:hypothetical protein